MLIHPGFGYYVAIKKITKLTLIILVKLITLDEITFDPTVYIT